MNNNKIEEQFLLAVRLHSQREEVWLPIKGYPKHEISSTGRIRNIKTKRILKQRTNNGYRQICLSNNGESKKLTVHRLVCSAFHLNPHSKPCVDHIDNNKTNNHIQNLRWVTHSENGMNQSKHCNNKSGATGVYWHKHGKKWCATIQIDGITKHLGYFRSLEKAKKARITAVDKMFGSFANQQSNK